MALTYRQIVFYTIMRVEAGIRSSSFELHTDPLDRRVERGDLDNLSFLEGSFFDTAFEDELDGPDLIIRRFDEEPLYDAMPSERPKRSRYSEMADDRAYDVFRRDKKVREEELLQREKRKDPRTIVQYELSFDRENYRKINLLKTQDSQEYEKQKKLLDEHTKRQLETAIGERLFVGISETRYDLRNGELYNQNSDEPFINVIERGRTYRKEHGSTETEREAAEVIGFEKIQTVLGDADTPIGTMIVSVSPPGTAENTIYKHNFYDIFTKRQNEKGESYIEARRYSSALSLEEYKIRAGEISLTFEKDRYETDADFLAHPFLVNLKTPQAVHEFLHKEHPYRTQEEFENIKRECHDELTYYINVVSKNPDDVKAQQLAFRILMNAVDVAAGERTDIQINKGMSFEQRIRELGSLPMIPMSTGCGFSADMLGGVGGASSFASSTGVMSVSEFGSGKSDRFGPLQIQCPSCFVKYERTPNELEKKCKYCNSEKIAC